MPETFFAELKRYVRFLPEDEALLSALAGPTAHHYAAVAEAFYQTLAQHPEALEVLEGPSQLERLKSSLRDWMALLFSGPWDESYAERRSRIGRVHVRIGLPQRYMFAAMSLIRGSLVMAIEQILDQQPERKQASVVALNKLLDIELAIMLESYRESFVDQVQELERAEKSHLQSELAMSEARYHEIFETAEALIVTFDRDAQIMLFNRQSERVTGLSRDEARGKSFLELFVPEADRPRLSSTLRELLSGRESAAYEAPVSAKHGLGRLIRWHFTTLPQLSESLSCAIGIDLSEEHAQRLKTQRAERLASLGTMAAGLAHEIRNPLNAAHLQLSVADRRLLRIQSEPTEAIRAAVRLANGEIQRLATLVEDFLQFARPQPLRLAAADLLATAEATVALVRPEAEAKGVRVLLLPGEPVHAQLDDEKMKQVLHNLLRNAVEAAAQGGRVEVQVRTSAGHVLLLVSDDGKGLPPEASIFEPFFTTKEQGTGLGLAIVHRIVTDHRGTIEVESRPGRTVFTVSIPL